MGRKRVRAVGYVFTAPGEALFDPAAFEARGLTQRSQRQAIARAAAARRWRLVDVVVENAEPEEIDQRIGLARVIDMVREGTVEAIVVMSLDRLAPDLVLQELLIGELRRAGARIVSLRRGEIAQLADPSPDPERALVRRSIRATPVFQGDLRALHAGHRMARARAGEEDLMVALERIAERGGDTASMRREARRWSVGQRRARTS